MRINNLVETFLECNLDSIYCNYKQLQQKLSTMPRSKSQHIREEALKAFQDHGGVLRTSEALAAGIHPRILYELKAEGRIEKIAKGFYALPGLPNINQPDFVMIAKKVPSGIICLVSALCFHELTVQIPRWVDVAIRQSYHPPSIPYPPVHFHWFSNNVFEAGIEEHDIGGIEIKIYSQEKSIVDCFRLRSKVGVDVAVEALKAYWRQGKTDIDLLRRLAKASKMLQVMTPYIETVIHDQS